MINKGFIPIYSDTDSIYFCDNLDWDLSTSDTKFQQLIDDHIVDLSGNLGAPKPEIHEKIGQSYCDNACFISLKMYALKQGDKEIITCKGLSRRFTGTDERSKEWVKHFTRDSRTICY